MGQDGGYDIDGGKDASEYYWTGAKGERPAYSKAYADSRSDGKYMENVGKGGLNYDSARMKDEGDAAASKYERQKMQTKKNRKSSRKS